ncbi:hypothetical protein C8R45DRAFT_1072845, partial [Mycena sanguinolenta]
TSSEWGALSRTNKVRLILRRGDANLNAIFKIYSQRDVTDACLSAHRHPCGHSSRVHTPTATHLHARLDSCEHGDCAPVRRVPNGCCVAHSNVRTRCERYSESGRLGVCARLRRHDAARGPDTRYGQSPRWRSDAPRGRGHGARSECGRCADASTAGAASPAGRPAGARTSSAGRPACGSRGQTTRKGGTTSEGGNVVGGRGRAAKVGCDGVRV